MRAECVLKSRKRNSINSMAKKVNNQVDMHEPRSSTRFGLRPSRVLGRFSVARRSPLRSHGSAAIGFRTASPCGRYTAAATSHRPPAPCMRLRRTRRHGGVRCCGLLATPCVQLCSSAVRAPCCGAWALLLPAAALPRRRQQPPVGATHKRREAGARTFITLHAAGTVCVVCVAWCVVGVCAHVCTRGAPPEPCRGAVTGWSESTGQADAAPGATHREADRRGRNWGRVATANGAGATTQHRPIDSECGWVVDSKRHSTGRPSAAHLPCTGARCIRRDTRPTCRRGGVDCPPA